MNLLRKHIRLKNKSEITHPVITCSNKKSVYDYKIEKLIKKKRRITIFVTAVFFSWILILFAEVPSLSVFLAIINILLIDYAFIKNQSINIQISDLKKQNEDEKNHIREKRIYKVKQDIFRSQMIHYSSKKSNNCNFFISWTGQPKNNIFVS